MNKTLLALYRFFALCLSTLWISVLVLASSVVVADDSRPASLTITGDNNVFLVTWKRPIKGKQIPELGIVFDADTQQISLRSTEASDNAIVERWNVQRQKGLAGINIRVEGLVGSSYQVLVRIPGKGQSVLTTILNTETPSFTLPSDPSKLFESTLLTYLTLGFEHILVGVDHLLFVFALMLLIPNVTNLLITITAFTLAHSVTLIGASLGWIQVPGPPVEAAIALSIVFLARELVLIQKGHDSLAARFPWMVAFAFGLLHGMGFAGALAEIGLPDSEVVSALLAFNIGVELGQIVFVAAILLLLAVARRTKLLLASRFQNLPAYVVGSIASIWLFERLASF